MPSTNKCCLTFAYPGSRSRAGGSAVAGVASAFCWLRSARRSSTLQYSSCSFSRPSCVCGGACVCLRGALQCSAGTVQRRHSTSAMRVMVRRHSVVQAQCSVHAANKGSVACTHLDLLDDHAIHVALGLELL